MTAEDFLSFLSLLIFPFNKIVVIVASVSQLKCSLLREYRWSEFNLFNSTIHLDILQPISRVLKRARSATIIQFSRANFLILFPELKLLLHAFLFQLNLN